MSEPEEEQEPAPNEEEQSMWAAVEELKRSNLVIKKALGRQNLESQALHEAIEAIAQAQQASQEKLVEYFEDLGEEDMPKSKKRKNMSKRTKQEVEEQEREVDETEDEGFSTTTKMFLSGLAGFAAGSAVTTLYFKYGPGAGSSLPQSAPQGQLDQISSGFAQPANVARMTGR